MTKILIYIHGFLIFFVSITGISFLTNIDKTQIKNYQVMRLVDSMESAKSYENLYDIKMVDYSKYGFAVYETDNQNTYTKLLTDDFYDNNLNKTESISYSRFDDTDPYRDDQYALDMLNIDEAWTYSIGSMETVVAIVDSGIDINHNEFIGRISPLSYNAKIDEIGISFVDDDTGHGTMVAGIIGALTGNDRGISGIMQEVTLLIIKANNFDDPETIDTNEADYYWDSTIADSIYYAVDHGADVINLSLGSDFANPVLRTAINYAYENNVAIVAASGNDGINEKIYPASFDHVVSVSSVNRFQQVSTFSNYNDSVDISAPGEAIITTSINNTYVEVLGTSFAAPHVSGILGLLISYDPTQQVDKLYDRIFQTAKDRGNEGLDIYYGYGIVDAYQAILYSEYQVSLVTGLTYYPTSVFVNYGETFELNDPIKVGYVFDGWYRDPLFTEAFTVGVDVVLGDMTLYAKFDIISYNVTFVFFDQTTITMSYDYGSIVDWEPDEVEGFRFFSWYYNSQFTLKYDEEGIYRDLTLYAKHDPITYQVEYMINDTLRYQVTVDYAEIFELFYPPQTEAIITGWYLDEDFTILYEPTETYQDLILYGKVDQNQLRVNFYDMDQETLLYSTVVSYGQSVTPPDPIERLDSEVLDFTFLGWSEPTDFIENNLNVYAVYDIEYHPENVILLPGMDTIYDDEIWEDGGLYYNDRRLTVIYENLVPQEPGRYVLYYHIYYLQYKLDQRVRVVNVIERPIPVRITIKPDVTTFQAGEQYYDAGVSTNVGSLKIIKNVNPNVPGIYSITYQVTYGEEVFFRTKYVYVLERVVDRTDPAYLSKERDEVIL